MTEGQDLSGEIMEPDTVEKSATIPVAQIDASRPSLFQKYTIDLFFHRLRKEDPMHYCRASNVRPYWPAIRLNDIMTAAASHKVFSSEAKFGGIVIQD